VSSTSTLTDQCPRPLDRSASGSNGAAGRTIRPRRGLPGSRAVVGGLLVALAAVGTWVVATGSGTATGGRYLVAARPIGPGERIEAGDVRWSSVDLPESLQPAAFDDADGIVGAVALGPIQDGELLQAGSIAPAAGTPSTREVSFAVEADWAVAGTLRAGDRIDVIATTEDSEGPTSTRVLADSTIRRIDSSGGDGLGESRSQTITVAVESASDAEALVTAARAATVTVLRVTGTEADGGGGG